MSIRKAFFVFLFVKVRLVLLLLLLLFSNVDKPFVGVPTGPWFTAEFKD